MISDEDLHRLTQEALRITAELNGSYHTVEEVRELLEQLTEAEIPDTVVVSPPFYTDCGKFTRFGERVFLNCGCFLQDLGGIEIGDDAEIGPGTKIVTVNHHPDPERRWERFPEPVRIGKNAWVGAGAVILPGVTVGENAIVAAGSVVTEDVPAGTLAAGNPAKVIREL